MRSLQRPKGYSLRPKACSSRRGVLLLVVLSLLVLFAMIAVTFVLVAGQYRRTSRAAGRAEQTGDDPQGQVDEVFSQLVRDTNDPRSSLFRHSLLADIYGLDGVTGTLTASAADGNGAGYVPATATAPTQFLDLFVVHTTAAPKLFNLRDPATGTYLPYPLESQLQTTGFYNGCVLTMTSGPAKGTSMRIVGWGYSPGSSLYTIRAMPLEVSDGAALVNLCANTNLDNQFVINGRPFNGTGFGFNPSADPTTVDTLLKSRKDFTVGGTPTPIHNAHLQNPKFFQDNSADTSAAASSETTKYRTFGGYGGPDEDYDVADPQNMHLAYVPIGPIASANQILPSLHRPELVNYLKSNNLSVWNDPTAGPQLIRQSILRPFGPTIGLGPGITPDHPAFTGSNTLGQFDPINGPWDVDNDGDGVTDSIWVDVGLPIQTAADGRRVKPLVAILCTDLDGRMNVNAHGNPVQAQNNYYTPIAAGANKIGNYQFHTSGTPQTITQPRGMGYGPAEINLGHPSVGLFPGMVDYQNFYNGLAANGVIYEGRYGDYQMPGGALPGTQSGTNSADNKLDRMKNFRLPLLNTSTPPFKYNYYAAPPTGYSPQTIFGTPPDYSGRSVFGVDYAGQPIYSFYSIMTGAPDVLGTADNEFPNNPYSFNLSRNRARSSTVSPSNWGDNPFTATELERIVRQYDLDATGLPDRLRYLLNPGGAVRPELAQLVTTDSFDLPSPSMLPTRDVAALTKGQTSGLPAPFANTVLPSMSVVDLLRTRLAAARSWSVPLTPAQIGILNTEVTRLLAPEVIAGQRFDLNRPLGNGLDDTALPTDPGYGVIDEPEEYAAKSEATNWNGAIGTGPAAFSTTTNLDLNNDGAITPVPGVANSDMYARQQYAKYLYIMAMLVTDVTYNWSTETPPTGVTLVQRDIELNARRIAQWAINVVDFYDADSVMTPFEYDAYPFNNLPIDWDFYNAPLAAETDARVVWGAESPSLIITETLALHDRRVVDEDNGDKKLDPSIMDHDTDMDQGRLPQGSLFVELYCPQPSNGAQPIARSGDLYTLDTNDNQWKLDLSRVAGGVSPVWRLAITGATVIPDASGKPNANDVTSRLINYPDSGNLDPYLLTYAANDPLHSSMFDPANPSAANPVTVERWVWFTTAPPPTDQEISYYNRDGCLVNVGGQPKSLLVPGRYAVVGPRPSTSIGVLSPPTALSSQVISFNTTSPGRVLYTPSNATAPNATNTDEPALPIVCVSALAPIGYADSVGLSVSEPVPRPLLPGHTYYDPPATASGTPTGNTAIDAPANRQHPQDGSSVFNRLGKPLSEAPGLFATGLKPNYKTVLLQRLANPLVAYDATTNPYITVDWQPIDLNVFNGEAVQGTDKDPDDTAFQSPNRKPMLRFSGRERGSQSVTSDTSDPWPVLATQSSTVNASLGALAVHDYNVNNSLGYLNKSLGTRWGNSAPGAGANLAFYNAPNPTAAPLQAPFPWLTWNDRPYISAHELMLVPDASAEQMMRLATRNLTVNVNDASAAKPDSYYGNFRHLPNFFLSSNGMTGVSGAPYLYRLLEYVHVPSRFIGNETVLNPASFITPVNSASGLNEQQLASQYHPPFNRVSNYREPGRVNINTMGAQVGGTFSPAWNAILNGGPGPQWPVIVASRRGETAVGADVLAPIPSTWPTYFPRPFRSAGGAAFNLPGIPAPPELPPFGLESRATLMRPDPALPINPLFNFVNGTTPGPTDPSRNAYFRYQPLQKISNLVTTRSNVYAVWITLGYFEATPNPAGVDAAHPDGYQYGAELGSDSGEVKRRRGFYIYDRSIPVGFEPGKDHNIDRGILVKRFIE